MLHRPPKPTRRRERSSTSSALRSARYYKRQHSKIGRTRSPLRVYPLQLSDAERTWLLARPELKELPPDASELEMRSAIGELVKRQWLKAPH